MNANILVPIIEAIFTVSSAPCITFLKIINMTVAIVAAAVVVKAVTNVNIAIENVAHLVYTLNGVKKIETKLVHAPVRNSANIAWLASLTNRSASITVEGSAMVAPARSSERIISTGLNQ